MNPQQFVGKWRDTPLRERAAAQEHFIIRPATAADQRRITSLVHSARLNPIGLAWPNFLIAQQLDADPPRIAGIGQLRPHRDSILELASLAVVPEAQGRGVGSQLVEALIRKADRPLYLMCTNEKVIYYERFGFSELTSAQTMPRSLRRIYRLAKVVEPVIGLFIKDRAHLAIMVHKSLPL